MENSPYITLEEAMRSIKKIATRVSELVKLTRITRDQLSVSASMFLEIKDKTQTKNSPQINTAEADVVRIRGIEKLRKNYGVLRDLFDTKNELDVMESKLRTTKFGKVSPEKALSELSRLRKEVLNGISESFSFISGLAKAHMPDKLDLFSKGICASIEKSIIYQEGRLFSYIFEDEGDLCFTVYLQLKHAEDENGTIFPELFLTMTYKTGNSPKMYVGMQHHFTPPSAGLLVKRVTSIKDALSAYNHLLELDDFSNTLGSLPLSVLLNPKSIVKDMFSYKEHVRAVEVDEDLISFHLKSSALNFLSDITSQLFKELNSVQRRSNAKLRMSVKKSKTGATVSFRFVMSRNAPPVDASDLEFMKDRFNVDDKTMQKIVRVLNVGN